MLYGYACNEEKQRGYQRVITYTRADEAGTSLRAAGFVRDGRMTKGGSWHHKNRPRPNARQSPAASSVGDASWARLATG